jgi:transcriptional regulator
MYVPKAFEENRIDVMHRLIRENPLASLVVQTAGGMEANHIPLHVKMDGSEFGTLVGHIARANPLWKIFNADAQVLIIFQGANTYISPSWYATKKENGKVAPTWNYTVVHASGFMRAIEDPVWIRELLEMLTDEHEAQFTTPWSVGDAPADYVEKLIGAVVGIEISVSTMIGKWKVSQNQPENNRKSVIESLTSSSSPQHQHMAELIKSN